MIRILMKVSMPTWTTAFLFVAIAGVQPASAPAHLERVLRDFAAGHRSLDGIRLETQCLDEGSFVKATAHGSGVAIWNGERQGTLSREEVLSLLRAFVKERFARMPTAFGEEDDEPARMAVNMTCRVRFSGGGLAKEVIQLDKGEQSAALKRLARGVLGAARDATRNAVPVHSLDEGLAAVAAGRLAVETVRITMRSGAGVGLRDKDPRGWVLRVDGRDAEIDPDVGVKTSRRLEETALRDLARVLAETQFAALPLNIPATDYIELTVAVLGQEHAVQARQFTTNNAQDPAIHARFQRAVAAIAALRGQ